MPDYQDCYCVKFDIPQDKSLSSSELVKGMEMVLTNFEELNRNCIRNINGDLDVVAYIEELESGSIKVWLRDKLIGIDDTTIDNLVDKPIKTTISACLKSMRNKAIEKLNDTTTLSLEQRADLIINDVQAVLEQYTDDLKDILPEGDIELNRDSLLLHLSSISKGSKVLKNNVHFKASNDEADEWQPIDTSFEYDSIVDEDELDPQEIVAHIVVYSPVYDMSAKTWKFKLHDDIKSIDISESNIPEVVFKRGGANVNDTFKVKLQITEKKTKTGYKTEYKVIDVITYIWAAEQIPLNI